MILFDVDGVMLSEERYFDASALTVYELLTSPRYLGLSIPGLPKFHEDVTEEEIREIRNVIFGRDIVLNFMKKRGINANWDMVFLQTAFCLYQALLVTPNQSSVVGELTREVTQTTLASAGVKLRAQLESVYIDFEIFNLMFATDDSKRELFSRVNELFEELGIRNVVEREGLWMVCTNAFQEWYLGDAYSEKPREPTGKRGFLNDEIPLCEPKLLADLFQTLSDSRIVLGIATGRPDVETYTPLQQLGWLNMFDQSRITTASDVLKAEEERGEGIPLSKPHPFPYARSFLGSSFSEALTMELPLSAEIGEKVLVIGDSVADALAAKALGVKFAAVLTGLDGEKARVQFEELEADYILQGVLELKDIVLVSAE